MKNLTLTLLSLTFIAGINLSAQFVAKMQVKEDIPGICDKNEVYAIFPMIKGQEEAVPPISEKALEKRLNAEVQFLKDNPDHEDKGMMGLVVNCKGELVQCRMDNKTQSPDLDQQIEAVFATLLKWTAGKVYGKPVDTSILFSFTIKNGKLTLN